MLGSRKSDGKTGPGLSSSRSEFNKALWADAELAHVDVTYDTIYLTLVESTGKSNVLRAAGYIGYKVVGFWDESIVERAEYLERHAFIDECLESIDSRLGSRKPDTGSPARNEQTWFALIIHLIDGAVLQIAAAALRTEPVS